MSYKIIKSIQIKNEGTRSIDTKYQYDKNNKTGINDQTKEEASEILESYENIAENIIRNAQKRAEEIQKKALIDAMTIEKEAYEKAYEEGQNRGYDDGYKTAYDKAMNDCSIEEERILSNANNVLNQCQEHYTNYLRVKEVEIKETIISICEEILKKEMEQDEGLNSIVFNVLSGIKKAKKLIIRCNEKYYDSIFNSLEDWQNELTYRAEMFLIKDQRLNDGEALVEKDNGVTKIDINYSLDKIREIILYEE